MPHQRVVVEIYFGVERENAAVVGHDQRIDFHQRRVGLDVSLVQSIQQRDQLIHFARLQSQPIADFPRLERRQAGAAVDIFLQDCVGIFLGDLLDLHAARSRGHDHQLRFGAIQQHAEIEFACDRQRFFDQQPSNDAAFRASLVSHQLHAEHVRRQLARLFDGLGDLHTAALAAATGVDLRFHHNSGSAFGKQFFGDGFSFFAAAGYLAAGDRYAILRQDRFCLVFVYFHEFIPVVTCSAAAETETRDCIGALRAGAIV